MEKNVIEIVPKSYEEILQEGLLHFGNKLQEISYKDLIQEIQRMLNRLTKEVNSGIFDQDSLKVISHGYPEIFQKSKNDNRCSMWYKALVPFSIETLSRLNTISENSVEYELIRIKNCVEEESMYFECNLLYTDSLHTKISLFFTLDSENYILHDVIHKDDKSINSTVSEFISEVNNYKKDIISLLNKCNFNNAIKVNPIFEKIKDDNYDIYRFWLDKRNTVAAIKISDIFLLKNFNKNYNLTFNDLYFIVFQNIKYIFDEELLNDTNLMILMGEKSKEFNLYITTKANIKIKEL